LVFYPGASSDGATYTVDTGSNVIWGAQLEEGSTATAYQKVVSEYDVTEAGVDSLWYLDFDGVDDHLRADGVLLYAVGEASVFAGVNGPTGSNEYLIGESNSTDNDPIYALATKSGATTGDELDALIRTDASASILPQSGGPTAFDSTDRVISVIDSGSSVTPRVDGIAGTAKFYTRTGTLTTDRFTIGGLTRAAFSSAYDGRIYGLILRGAASTAQEISDTEAYLANLSGVTL